MPLGRSPLINPEERGLQRIGVCGIDPIRYSAAKRVVSALPGKGDGNVGSSTFIVVAIEWLAEMPDVFLSNCDGKLAIHLYAKGDATHILGELLQSFGQAVHFPWDIGLCGRTEE